MSVDNGVYTVTSVNGVNTLTFDAGVSGDAIQLVNLTGTSGTIILDVRSIGQQTYNFTNVQELVVSGSSSGSPVDGVSIGSVSSINNVADLLQTNGSITILGSLRLTGGLDPASVGTIFIEGPSTFEVASAIGSGNTIALYSSNTADPLLLSLIIDDVSLFGTGQGTAAYAGPRIELDGQSFSIDLVDVSSASASIQGFDATTGLLQVGDGTHTADLLFSPITFSTPSMPFATEPDGSGGTLVVIACYARGTRILTIRGETAVEDLQIGDLVVTFAGRGPVLKPVRWMGHRGIDLRKHTDPENTLPIRFRAGSLGDGCPNRDLVVSPGHRMRIDDSLVTALELVNGATVVQESPDAAEYWHIELDGHDLVLAEGVQAETYQDTGNRSAFDNGTVVVMNPVLDGDVPQPCLPYAGASSAVRARLIAQAEALGWTRTTDPAPWLEANGQRIEPVRYDDRYRFNLPSGCQIARLRSRTTRPWDVDPYSGDRRQLGLKLHYLALKGPGGVHKVMLDSPALREGIHAVELDAEGRTCRWTTGNMPLDMTALAPGMDFAVLEIASDQALPMWVAPQQKDFCIDRFRRHQNPR